MRSKLSIWHGGPLGPDHLSNQSVAHTDPDALIWGMPRSTASSHRPLLALTLVVAMAFGACSSDDDAAPGSTTTDSASSTTVAPTTTTQASTTTSAAPSTTTTAVDESAEVVAAVRAFWDTYLEVGATTGPFDAEATRARLAERSTGASLDRLVTYFSSNAASGYVVQGSIDLAPTVVSINGDTAQVRDCYDDTTSLIRISDGVRVDTDNPLRHEVLMTLVREDGVWKVSAISDEGDGCTV